jgi:hypothetical protein
MAIVICFVDGVSNTLMIHTDMIAIVYWFLIHY